MQPQYSKLEATLLTKDTCVRRAWQCLIALEMNMSDSNANVPHLLKICGHQLCNICSRVYFQSFRHF